MKNIVLLLAIAGSSLFLNGCSRTSPNGNTSKADVGTKQETPQDRQMPAQISVSSTSIKITFKMDPRITRGMYMGDRWVSPATYTRVGEGKTCAVEARAYILDATGKQVAASLKWITSDPDMITVSPSQGNETKITVHGAGQSSVEVISEGISKKLSVKAVYIDNATEVKISQ